MKENGKRREWVKTAAIVFLSVMLVLTFFSNTIMNYSLPEVATQYVMSGSITAKIRGTGTVESGDPYNVKIKESRKVASVAVRVGDEVQKGDILMYLEDADSEELKAALAVLEEAKDSLKAAQDAVADAKDDYDRALLNADISTSDIQAANGGISPSSYRSKITEFQNAIKALENELAPLEQKVAELNKGLSDVSAQESYEKAQDDAAREKVSATQTAYYHATGVSGENAEAEAAQKLTEAYKAYQDAQKALTDAQNTLKAAQDAAANLGELKSDLQVAKSELQAAQVELETAKTAFDQANEAWKANETDEALKKERDEAEEEYKSAEGKRNKAQLNAENAQATVNAVEGADLQALKAAVDKAQNDCNNKKAAYDSLYNVKAAYDAAVQANKEREASTIYATLSSLRSNYQIELYSVNKSVDDKKAEIAKKQNEMADLLSKVDRIMGIENYLDAIDKAQDQVTKAQGRVDKAQEEVDKQTANSIGATITAPIAGTVTGLNVQAGETTYNDMTVVVMQPEGRGYTMSFSVTNEQAKTLSVGDKADLINAWRYDDVTVTLKSIKTDTQDPGQKKLLTFDVTGNVIAGQSLSVSVGQKSNNYDYIVPNSAIREDNNGKFILIVTSKPGPLSTRYIASRVDVEVLASDDTQSAIRGALNSYDFVITTSTKPVEPGQQVRLSGN